MNIDLPHDLRHSSTVRSFSGCWTCRLRRKKCDEKHPVCGSCAGLIVTCYYGQDKPDWMDGGAKQEEMAEQLKREIKVNAHRRRGDRIFHTSGDQISGPEAITRELMTLSQKKPIDITAPVCDLLKAATGSHVDGTDPNPKSSSNSIERETDYTLTYKSTRETRAVERSETVLVMFYLEHLFPFLFPFYRPSLVHGGRAWILEMMLNRPVVRQATLCQSSYFFSLAQGGVCRNAAFDVVLTQTRDAFEVLRQALQVVVSSNIIEHLPGSVRVMASIMQVQRFEIGLLSFDNCQAHLNAAVALFKQLLNSLGPVESMCPSSRFNALLSRLGPPSLILPSQGIQIPSAEQAALRFSSALLILDDIIASTVLQEQPSLYEYHRYLLSNADGTELSIDLEAVVGCQNWVLIQLGEIAMLDAWKQRCKRAKNLDVMELVNRATVIKSSLETNLTRLETEPANIPKNDSSLLDVFMSGNCQQLAIPASQSSLVTRVWAHAALIHLLVVVSGWQPTNTEVHYHVGRVIELLTHRVSPPALLRTMVWPFCVAGCLAVPAQEAQLRDMVETLQPASVFGTLRKANEIMENVWRSRNKEDAASRDLAMCLRSQGDLVLLV